MINSNVPGSCTWKEDEIGKPEFCNIWEQAVAITPNILQGSRCIILKLVTHYGFVVRSCYAHHGQCFILYRLQFANASAPCSSKNIIDIVTTSNCNCCILRNVCQREGWKLHQCVNCLSTFRTMSVRDFVKHWISTQTHLSWLAQFPSETT